MQIRYLINKLERIMNEKYPHIDSIERSIQQYKDYLKFIDDIKLFFLRNLKNSDFKLYNPPQLVNPVK